MGDELCCSREKEISFDFNYLKPEQNINKKENESIDEQDELNIIEQIQSKKNNNIINQTNTNSVVIQNDEFMYERLETKKEEIKQNNFFYNTVDEKGPQDSVIKNDEENKEKNEENNCLTDNIMDNDFPQDSNDINNIYDSNNINDNNTNNENKTNKENNENNDFVIDPNKIIIFYQSQENTDDKTNEEENQIKEDIIISDNNNRGNKEIVQTNLDNINIQIENNKEEIIENNIQDLFNDNSNSKVNNNEYLSENENKSSQINIENNELIENNINYKQEQNNELYPTNNNNINYENIFPEKNFDINHNKIQVEYIFENNNISQSKNNEILNEININENQTFFPKENISSNYSNDKTNYNIEYTSNDAIDNNNIYENLEKLYQTDNNIIESYETNNNIIESDYNKKPEVNIITTNNYQENKIQAYKPSNTYNINNNYNYLYNIETSDKPLFTDKEIDDLIKQAEQSQYNNYQNIPIQQNQESTIYKTISEYPIKTNKQQKTKINNYNYYPYLNQNYYNNLILTPEKKKNYYPLTPDNKTNKYTNNIIKNSKYLNNKKNVNINYSLITEPQKTTYDYGQYLNSNYNYINYTQSTKSKKNDEYYLYSSPAKENTNTNINYIYNPQKKLNNKKPNSQLVNNFKPLKYSIISNINNTNKTNIYQPKKIQNNPIINQSYLKSIQQSNQYNNNKKYVVNTLSSNYSNNDLNSSFSSSGSLSKSPKKYDKYGNPIYFKSLGETNKMLKEYQNRKNFHKIKSFSFDDIRKKNFSDDISNNDLSSYESPNSSPKNNQRNNFDLNSMNSISSINSFKSNNNNMKQSNLYQNSSQINPALSILTSTVENNFLDIDEQTKQIINRYITTDISSTSNFFPDNYKLFYPSNNAYFQIPQSNIKKQIKYYINKDPSKIAIYTGGINEINQRHGLGQLKENNCIKIGTWQNDIFSGWGRIIYNNSQVFEGKYENGKLNGKGVYKFKDSLYVGDFINNIREGKGVLINKRFRYKGQFNEGKINGYGKIVFFENKEGNGEYEGFFKDNNIEGKGIMKWKNGNIYQGEMKNGKMNGFGKFIPKGGFPIEGVFRNNVRVNVKK